MIACMATGSCHVFVSTVDAPTYMEIDGTGFTSKAEEANWRHIRPAGIDIEGGESFYYGYHRYLHSTDKSVRLILVTAQTEGLEMGKKYMIGRSDNENWQDFIPIVEYDDQAYYATEGWIVFHDIEVNDTEAYISGSFGFTATTEDGGKIIQVSKGTFEKVPSKYNYHNEGE